MSEETPELVVERMTTDFVMSRFLDLATAFGAVNEKAAISALDNIAVLMRDQLSDLKKHFDTSGMPNSMQYLRPVAENLREMILTAKDRARAAAGPRH